MPTFYEKLCAYDESKEIKKRIDELDKQYMDDRLNFNSWSELRELRIKLNELIEIVG